MNWTAITAISEVVGVVALVGSLLYLAFQVRFARLAAADTSRTARATGVREIDLTMVNNKELRKNWIKASKLSAIYKEIGAELNLDVDATLQVDTICQVWMRLHWGQFSSITNPEDLKDLQKLVSVFYSQTPMSICWEKGPYGRDVYDEKFVNFVEDAISKRAG
ncbi:MAG: hypothetical protein ACR2O3_17120 [Rhizobiaceae bacterium]